MQEPKINSSLVKLTAVDPTDPFIHKDFSGIKNNPPDNISIVFKKNRLFTYFFFISLTFFIFYLLFLVSGTSPTVCISSAFEGAADPLSHCDPPY
ncbi:MAG: hypothetical protein HEEMFOPI_00218 [Holosporales bacterium]